MTVTSLWTGNSLITFCIGAEYDLYFVYFFIFLLTQEGEVLLGVEERLYDVFTEEGFPADTFEFVDLLVVVLKQYSFLKAVFTDNTIFVFLIYM